MALTALGQAYRDYLKQNKGTPGNNTAQVASQTQIKTPGATSTGLAAAFNASKPAPSSSSGGTSSVSGSFNQPTNPAPPTTNYGGKGNPLNEILYSKKQYDAGNKNWAANNTQQFYSVLDPTESALVKGMNTQQLEDYINSKNGSGPANNGSSPSNISNVPSGSGSVSGSGVASPNTAGPTGYQSSYKGPDMAAMQAQLEALYGNRQSSETQKLRDALATALQGYNAQQTQAQQSAYNNRNAADVMSMQNQQQMDETLANAGLNTDGQNLTLQASQGASRLGAINDINQQESNALQDISQKRSLLQNNEAQNELALTQQIGSDKAAALYDLLKYGDTRAFDVDQSNYGRYRDDVNQQFAKDQFDWSKQTDLANLLGTIGGQQTLAAQNQGFNQQMSLADLMGTYNGQSTLAGKNANLNAALAVGNATGTVVKPTMNWGNLFDQASSGSAPLNLAGQQQQLNQTQVMAQLTGYLPNGKATTAQQQQQLSNLWAVADQTGKIPNELADMYGIPRGSQTQAAKQYAQNYNRGVLESDRNYGLQQDQNYLSYINAANKGDNQTPLSTVSPTAAASLLDKALTKVVGTDPVTKNPVYGKYTDPVQREKAFLEAWNTSGVAAGSDTIEMLSKAGYTPAEIDSYKQKYASAFNSGGAASGSYSTEIGTSAAKWGLPENLIAAVIDAESSGNKDAVSGAGAQGLMQLMPATAKGLGVTNPFDPSQNIDGGAQYLKGLLDTYNGDYAKALAGYNAGGGRVKKAISQYGNDWLAHMPAETQNYVKKILGNLGG